MAINMKIWLLSAYDETWGVFSADNMQGVNDTLAHEAQLIIADCLDNPIQYFTCTILEYELETTTPIRYANVTFNYATKEIVQSEWYSW